MKALPTDSAKRPAETPPDSLDTQLRKRKRREQLLQNDQRSQQADNPGAKQNSPATLPVVSQAALFASASNSAAAASGSTVPQSNMMQPSTRALGAAAEPQLAIGSTQPLGPAERLPSNLPSRLTQMTPLPPSMIGSATNLSRATTSAAVEPFSAGALPQSDRAGPSRSGAGQSPNATFSVAEQAWLVPPHPSSIDWDSLKSSCHKFGRQRNPPLQFDHMSVTAQLVVLGKNCNEKTIDTAKELIAGLKNDNLLIDFFKENKRSRRPVFERTLYRLIAFGVDINLKGVPDDYKSFERSSKEMVKVFQFLVNDYKNDIDYIDKEWMEIISKRQFHSIATGDESEFPSRNPRTNNPSSYPVAGPAAPTSDFPTGLSAASVSVGKQKPYNLLIDWDSLRNDFHTFGEQRNPPLRFQELTEKAQFLILGAHSTQKTLEIVKDLLHKIDSGQSIEYIIERLECKSRKFVIEKSLYKLIAFGVEIKDKNIFDKYGKFYTNNTNLQSVIRELSKSYLNNIGFINKEWRDINIRNNAQNNSTNIAGLGARSDLAYNSVHESTRPHAIDLSSIVTATVAGPSSASKSPQLPPVFTAVPSHLSNTSHLASFADVVTVNGLSQARSQPTGQHNPGEQRNPPLKLKHLPEVLQKFLCGSSIFEQLKEKIPQLDGEERQDYILKNVKRSTIAKLVYKFDYFGVELPTETWRSFCTPDQAQEINSRFVEELKNQYANKSARFDQAWLSAYCDRDKFSTSMPDRVGASANDTLQFPAAPSAGPVATGMEAGDHRTINLDALRSDFHQFGDQRNPPLQFGDLTAEAQIIVAGAALNKQLLHEARTIVEQIDNGYELKGTTGLNKKSRKITVERIINRLIGFGVKINNDDIFDKYKSLESNSIKMNKMLYVLKSDYRNHIHTIDKEWIDINTRNDQRYTPSHTDNEGVQFGLGKVVPVPTPTISSVANPSPVATAAAGPSSANAAPVVPQLPIELQQGEVQVAIGMASRSSLVENVSVPTPTIASVTDPSPAGTEAAGGPSSSNAALAASQLPAALTGAPQTHQPSSDTVKAEPESTAAARMLALPGLMPQFEIGDQYYEMEDPSGNVIAKSAIRTVLTPEVDMQEMSRRPIYQAYSDCNSPSPRLQQPYYLPRMVASYNTFSTHGVDKEAYDAIASRLEPLLQDPTLREAHELDNFDVVKIMPHNMPVNLQNDEAPHITVGMRGTIAKRDIPKFTPLQYSAQILSEDELLEYTETIGMQLISLGEMPAAEDGGVSEAAIQRADEMIAAYSWEARSINNNIKAVRPDGTTSSKPQMFYLNALGAGNVAALINHTDIEDCNMGVVYMRCQDENKKVTMKMTVYYTLEDIPKGTQLLVNYGPFYNFGTSSLPDITEEVEVPDEVRQAPQQQIAVKQEPEDR